MRPLLANWAFRLWRWLEPRSPQSIRQSALSKEYADATRQERFLLYRSLGTQPGFQLLMDELDDLKSIWERKARDLPAYASKNTAEVVKTQAVQIYEATFWTGWVQRKVSQATHHKFPVPTSTAAKNTDAPGLRGPNQKRQGV